MTEIDIEKYTLDVALKNLVLTELHLSAFSNAPLFCAECLSKHYLILSGSAEECIGVCHVSRTDVWHRLAVWADKARKELSSLTQEQANKTKAEARDFRKELEALSVQPETATGGHLSE